MREHTYQNFLSPAGFVTGVDGTAKAALDGVDALVFFIDDPTLKLNVGVSLPSSFVDVGAANENPPLVDDVFEEVDKLDPNRGAARAPNADGGVFVSFLFSVSMSLFPQLFSFTSFCSENEWLDVLFIIFFVFVASG